jgi:hypothetical protein
VSPLPKLKNLLLIAFLQLGMVVFRDPCVALWLALKSGGRDCHIGHMVRPAVLLCHARVIYSDFVIHCQLDQYASYDEVVLKVAFLRSVNIVGVHFQIPFGIGAGIR